MTVGVCPCRPGCLTVKDLAREVAHGQCRLETDEAFWRSFFLHPHRRVGRVKIHEFMVWFSGWMMIQLEELITH